MAHELTEKVINITLHERVPFGRWEIIDVEFPTANTDVIIRHGLEPENPYDVHYVVLKQTTSGVVYEDITPSRSPWTSDYIILRATTNGWLGRLMLCTLKTRRPFNPLDIGA